MPEARSTVTVGRPADEVFAFLADASNNEKWRSGILSVKHLSGEALGATFEQTMEGPGGRPISGDYRITTWTVPTLLAFEVISGPVRPRGTFALDAVSAHSTEVTFTLEIELTGVMRLMRGAVDKQLAIEAASIQGLSDAMGA